MFPPSSYQKGPGRGGRGRGRRGSCKSVSGQFQKITEEPLEIGLNNPVNLSGPT